MMRKRARVETERVEAVRLKGQVNNNLVIIVYPYNSGNVYVFTTHTL